MPTDADDDIPPELVNRPAPTDADVRRAMAEVREAVDNAAQFKELLARVANLEARVAAAHNAIGYQRSSFAQNLFLARVDEDGAWTEQAAAGSGTAVTLVDFAGGRSGSTTPLIPANQAAGSNSVQAVLQVRQGKQMQFFSLPTGAIVGALTQVGGVDGTSTAAPTYTYDATAVTFDAAGSPTPGAPLGSAMTPIVARPAGAVVPALYGLLLPADGGYVLLYAFEVPETGLC